MSQPHPLHSEPVPPTALIVVAAGQGTRMRAGTRKAYLELHARPVLFHTLERFRDLPFIRERFVVVAPQDVESVRRKWPELERDYAVDAVLPGGAERVYSVEAGLRAVGTVTASPSTELVAVHDAVRPLVRPAGIEAVCRRAAAIGGAILAHPISDTLKREAAASDGTGSGDASQRSIAATVPRAGLWAAQTPQVFRCDWLRRAFEAWHEAGEPPVTDDASLLERIELPVALVAGERTNLKLTTPEDLAVAEALLTQNFGAA